MALLYSLGNAPDGLTIDPNTGDLINAGGIPEGVYNVEVYVTDTDTGETSLCKIVPFSCAPNSTGGGISCDECIREHLAEHPHIPKTEINDCIDEKIAEFGVNWIPPEPQKDCCDKKVDRYSNCGHTLDIVDWDGDGIRNINETPVVHSYEDQPDPDAARIVVEVDENFHAIPNKPKFKVAGPAGPYAGLEKITHLEVCGVWVPLCCGGGPSSGDKCLLIGPQEVSYPFSFDTSDSLWQVGTQVVRFPGCGVERSTFCAGVVTSVFLDGLETTGGAKPNIGAHIQQGNVFLAPVSTLGCDGRLTDDTETNAGDIYLVDFRSWLGNQGPIKPETVQTMTLCFNVAGSPINLGVGMFDSYGKTGVDGDASYTWQPTVSVSGPQAVNNADYVTITGPGYYEISFDFHPSAVANMSNTLEVVFFGMSGVETIENYRLKVIHSDQEPCGVVNSSSDLTQLLTENDPNNNSWFVDTDGNICSIMPEGLCEIYQPPVFTLGGGISCCQVVNQSFPVQYDPLTDGWIVGNERIYFGGSGIFQTAQEMADWMTSNDPLNNIWEPSLNNSGNWDICALIDSAEKQEYKFLTYSGSDVFKCILEGVSFPLNYSTGDGWVIDGAVKQFPAGSVWFSASDLAAWMESVDPYNNDWTSYLVDAQSNTYSICGAVRADLCDNYSNLTYNGGDEFCCQAENLVFPVSYDPENDGWIVNNQLIPFGGDGTFTDAEEMLQFMDSNDPNTQNWVISEGLNGSYSICGWLPAGECADYSGMIISSGNTYYCDITGISFPFNVELLLEGWEVNGQVIGFTGDGTFETPAEFAQWLTDNDPNSFTWSYQQSGVPGVYDFCAFMPTTSTAAYNGIQDADYTCNLLTHTFPYEYNSADGWLINGEILSYYEVGGLGVFGTAGQFAQWLTDNDPNGYTWIHQGLTQDGHNRFCAVMPTSEQGQYQGFYDGIYMCIGNNLSFPLTYSTANGGWIIDGVFYPFGGDGTWDTIQDLLSWVNDTDPHENLWIIDNSSNICGYREFGETGYQSLQF